MSPAERMTALIQGAPIDRVPFNPFASSFSAKCYGIDGEQYYRYPENAFAASMHLIETYPWINYKPSYGWSERGAWEFGGDVAWPKENRYGSPLSAGPVIRTPDEVDSLIEPDPETAGMNPLQFEFNTLCIRNGYRASLPGSTPTTLSAGIVGWSNFSIGHEMDLTATSRFIGERHILAGNINNMVLLTGTVTDVKAEVKRCLAQGMAHPGGFVLMPACSLPPETPLENFMAIGETIATHGCY